MVKANSTLTESLEKYLLAVYEIIKINKAARVKDVSNYLKIGGPATSEAIKTLASRGFINYVPYGIITITNKGIEKIEQKLYRHDTISKFLEKVLIVSKEQIEFNANAIEYSMTDEVLDKFVKFLTFMEKCSCKEPKWVNSYKYYTDNGCMKEKCTHCVKNKELFDNSNCCSSCS